MKVMSMGKFQTSVVGETLLLEVIWEIPSSRPCRERGVSLGLAEPGGLAGKGAQGGLAGWGQGGTGAVPPWGPSPGRRRRRTCSRGHRIPGTAGGRERERERMSLGTHWEFLGVRLCPRQGAEGSLGQGDWDRQVGSGRLRLGWV